MPPEENQTKGYDKVSFKKVGVIGAGNDGCRIAYVNAKAYEVVLKDVSVAKAESGKDYIVQEQKKVTNGYTTEEKIAAHCKKFKLQIQMLI
jgi:3-hydroxyacyl-CoA dehydrogenase/enoyl-CoA hydratase/3-hydroxybutyryl-CoA epimerase